MESAPRVAALRARMDGSADAFVAMNPSNVRYLTGFDDVFDEEPSSVVVVTRDAVRVVTDSRFAEAASAAAQGTPWQITIATEPSLVAAATALSEAGISSVAIETSLPFARFSSFDADFGGDVIPADQWVEDARVVKEAAEVERIARAQALTDKAFDHILGFVGPGKSERDIALELEFFMRRNGSEGVAFPPIVASGPNSALPHAQVTDRILAPGDFLKLDFGARLCGYCADMTRTVVIGSASPEQRRIYEAVRAANLAGIQALAAGMTGAEVDAAARGVLETAGLADRFGHGLGHGVGLEVHEGPSLSPRGKEPLPEGAVVTVEPGVYVPGFGGVRIEDLAVVEQGGCRILTASPKDLIEV